MTRRRSARLLVSVAALVAVPLAAPLSAQGAAAASGAQEASGAAATAIDRAAAAYAKVRTARATFEQTLKNPLTGSVLVSRGEFLQQRPNRLAVRFTDPAGDRIVADGKYVWLYLPSTTPGQVIRTPVSQAAGVGTVDLTARFLDAPRARYTIGDAGADTVGGRPARVVTLVPRTAQPFVRATVWIDDADATVRQFEVVDQNGVTRRVRLTSLTLNGPVDGSAFAFKVPRGVKVYTQGEQAGR
jgi:outer membrane lipoprotein carrier protein